MRASALIGRVALMLSTALDPANKAAGVALSNSDLTATVTSGSNQGVRSTTGKSAGSFHAEITVGSNSNNSLEFGIVSGAANLTANLTAANSVTVLGGIIYVNGGFATALNAGTPGAGAVVAIEISGQDVWFQRGGQARQGPFTLSGSGPYFLGASGSTGDAATANFGASAFAITPTSGFSAWNSQ